MVMKVDSFESSLKNVKVPANFKFTLEWDEISQIEAKAKAIVVKNEEIKKNIIAGRFDIFNFVKSKVEVK